MENNKIFYGWWIVLASAVALAVMGPVSVAVANLFQNPVTQEFGITNSLLYGIAYKNAQK